MVWTVGASADRSNVMFCRRRQKGGGGGGGGESYQK